MGQATSHGHKGQTKKLLIDTNKKPSEESIAIRKVWKTYNQ